MPGPDPTELETVEEADMVIEMDLARNDKTTVQTVGEWVIRYGLVVVLTWIGAMKFTAYEAAGRNLVCRWRLSSQPL
jgi:hypothetical protein